MSTQKEKGIVGVFRCRVKGRGKGDFFAEFLTNEKAAHHLSALLIGRDL